MTTATQQDQQTKLDGLIDNLAKDEQVIELVKGIEKSIKTTQNHYGRYMSFLSNFKDTNARQLMSKALIKAGANAQGVYSAMQVIHGG